MFLVEFKLRNFVDITVLNDGSIFVIDSKFFLTHIKNGIEINTFNVQHEECSFKQNSTCLLSTQLFHIIGTTNGDLIQINIDNIEKSLLLKCRQSKPITKVFLIIF